MVKKNVKTCANCDGACCKYIAMELDCPEDLDDFENIKWYIIHKNVRVYVEDDCTWNIEFLTPCKNLGENNNCMAYDKRPKICRKYDHDECTFHNGYSEKYSFETIEDVDKYLEEVFEKGKHIVPEVEEDEEENTE